jgi:hypothetical protein
MAERAMQATPFQHVIQFRHGAADFELSNQTPHTIWKTIDWFRNFDERLRSRIIHVFHPIRKTWQMSVETNRLRAPGTSWKTAKCPLKKNFGESKDSMAKTFFSVLKHTPKCSLHENVLKLLLPICRWTTTRVRTMRTSNNHLPATLMPFARFKNYDGRKSNDEKKFV